MQTITTNVHGVITMKTQKVSSLGAAADKTLTLTPFDTAGVALTYSAPSSVQVARFKCVGLTMAPKYMPGSCR